MSSFWINKPLIVNFVEKNRKPKNILDSDTLLKFVQDELVNCPIKLKYTKHFSENMSHNEKLEVLDFINTNYNSDDDEYILSYSYDLFKFFFRDAVLVKFYLDFDNMDDMESCRYFRSQIGMVIGKKKSISVGNQNISCMEGNFLCVIKELRNLHLSSLMINILTKESIEIYGINCSYYTIGKDIKSPSFCTKYINIIPINVQHLYNLKFLTNKYPIEVHKKLYEVYDDNEYHDNEYDDNFDYKPNLRYINGNLGNLDLNQILEMIKSHSEDNYYVYDNMSITELRRLFMNKAFHHFLFFDKNYNKITNYICLFRLDYIKNVKDVTHASNNIDKCIKNGFLFLDTCRYDDSCMKQVLKYCHENDIFDMIITNKTFEDSLNIIKTGNKLNYYMYNIELSYTESSCNGLVTI